MNYFFTVQRKEDGKTDNIYEFDFKNGQFIGGAGTYRYDDVSYFIGVPSDILKEICKKPQKRSVKSEETECSVDLI